MKKLDLIDEAHKSLAEISLMRADFKNKRINVECAKTSVGIFNATSRALTIAINAEKWISSKGKISKAKKK